MRGTKRKRREGVWELRVYLGRDPASGNPRQISKTFTGPHGRQMRLSGALLTGTRRAGWTVLGQRSKCMPNMDRVAIVNDDGGQVAEKSRASSSTQKAL
jgi:hypothetical protein